jgi:hypothetical protein
MRKKIKITEAGLMGFFKSFFRAKSDGKESEWLSSLRSKSPELADIWTDYDDKLSKDIAFQRQMMQKYGGDTKHLDDFQKKYGIK